jgi:hypothetical protein
MAATSNVREWCPGTIAGVVVGAGKAMCVRVSNRGLATMSNGGRMAGREGGAPVAGDAGKAVRGRGLNGKAGRTRRQVARYRRA